MKSSRSSAGVRSSQSIQRDLQMLDRLEWLHRTLFLNRLAPRTGPVIRNRQYGDLEPAKQSLDLILPKCGTGWPVLLFIHGGGFSSQDKASYQRLGKTFAHNGYLFCNIDYRLAPRWKYPVQLTDIGAAARWCWEHVRDFGGDRERIFLAGDSAGAYLAGMYAAALGDARLLRELDIYQEIPARSLRGLLLFYGIYDLETALATQFPLVGKMTRDFLGTDPDEFRHRAHLASPLRHLTPGFPPTLLCSSDLDPLHAQTLELDQALSAAGVRHENVFLRGEEYPNAYHGFLPYWNRKASRMVLNDALQFMDGLR